MILPEGSWTTEVVTVTWVEVNAETKTITQTWESGLMVISSTHGYTESHVVHVIAYDAAGNETESEKVRFYIVHKPKEKEEEEEEGGRDGRDLVAKGQPGGRPGGQRRCCLAWATRVLQPST